MCHILFQCQGSLSIPSNAAHQLIERIGEAETNCFPNMHVQDFCTMLLNHSRDKDFMTFIAVKTHSGMCLLFKILCKINTIALFFVFFFTYHCIFDVKLQCVCVCFF